MTRPASSLVRTTAFVLFNIGAVLGLLLMFEGAASVYYTFRDTFASPPVAESLYTEYDRDLGWVNLPNIYLPNMYGPGKYLKTNSQRFRNNQDFTLQVPPGKTRIICSGDSFTFGFGVDNDHTWAQQLAARAPNIETVNMGQGGYGADQAYLWYKRDAAELDHNIQILALIAPDLYRMQHSSFNEYGKPVLAVQNDHLVTTNVPVPRSLAVRSPRLLRVQNALFNLNITHLLRRMLNLDTEAAVTATRKERNRETSWVLSYMLDDLLATNRARNSVLVLVYLPTREDYGGDTGTGWRRFLAQYAQHQSVLYLDLTDDFRRLSPAEVDSMFIGTGTVNFLGAAGHYNEAGNAFVADLIYQRLLANPETAAKLHAQPISAGLSRSDTVKSLAHQER
ncbi:MAG: SGNH/GDSL hydrolase family protein [Candidatus Korobacteraceae bacterium]